MVSLADMDSATKYSEPGATVCISSVSVFGLNVLSLL